MATVAEFLPDVYEHFALRANFLPGLHVRVRRSDCLLERFRPRFDPAHAFGIRSLHRTLRMDAFLRITDLSADGAEFSHWRRIQRQGFLIHAHRP